MAMNKRETEQFNAAIRLIKAMRDPDVDTIKARSDVGMYRAQRELREAEEHAKSVGLKF